MVQEKQLKELFKYIEANWDVCVEDVDKRDIKRIFGGVLCDDIMNDTDQVTDQEPEQVAEPEELKCNCTTFDMSRLVNQEYKPTEKTSSQVKVDNSFDKDRFEAMFRAVVANGGHELCHKQAIELTEEALAKLDAYYAEKKGGNNE